MSSLIRHSLMKNVSNMGPNFTQKATLVAGPPKHPMPFTEKLALGGTMCVAIVSPMFWIMANIKNYKKPKE